MTLRELLDELKRAGVELHPEGDTLHFRAPKGALSPALREQLLAHKPELLAHLRSARPSAEGATPSAARKDEANRYEPFPLTPMQRAFWVGRTGAFELGNVAAHFYVELVGVGLDLERLTLALRKVIARHDTMRAIVHEDGQQKVLEHVPLFTPRAQDLRGMSAAEATARVEAFRAEMSHEVRDPATWPLFDVRVSRLTDERCHVHVSVDLLIADAMSLRLIFLDWRRHYEDPELSLAPPGLSFRDYILSEPGARDPQARERSTRYWDGRIASLPPAPNFPLVKPLAAVTRPFYVRYNGTLDRELWHLLKARGRKAGLTPTVILLTAFADLLSAWTMSPRFCLNLTLYNRLPLHPDIQEIIGDFTSGSLLEVDVSAERTFEERAARIQRQLWSDLEHREVSSLYVLQELARMHGGSRAAAMPVVFTSAMGQYSSESEPLPTAWLGEIAYSISQTSQVAVDHHVFEEQGALLFNWDVIDELFPPGYIGALSTAYTAWLKRLAEEETAWIEPARRFVPEAQLAQRQAVHVSAPAPTGLLHDHFVARAERAPDAPAIVTDERTVTYGELLRRARQLGRFLRQTGAEPNTLVALCMEKGWEQIVGALGILLSGAAYLPIDPGLPRERLHGLLEHGDVRWVVTQPWIDRRVAWPAGIERLCVEMAPLPNVSDAPLEPAQKPDDLAYVLYTSGSTGQPKGVMLEHRAPLNTILDVNARLGVGDRDRIIALSAMSFDLSVYDVFGGLAAGATLVMPSASGSRDPAHWAELVARHGVTLWNSVPALMEMLIEHTSRQPSARLGSLRAILLSGDWIPVSLPARIKAQIPHADVIGLGGPTEASIWQAMYPIREVRSDWKSVPYGHPLTNHRLHILDGALDPCPVWVPGEIYIGGAGLARGYWRDEERTNAQFIVHPETGERLYRSSDVARYLPDGNIEFLGRQDLQVKVSGHRVDLGEIEAALMQHPGVFAAVTSTFGERGSFRLVVYVVPAGASPPSADELHGHLSTKLPDYMIPSTFVTLAALPLSTNGKVDRKALPPPEHGHDAEDPSFVGPRDPLEHELASIFSAVLGATKVGIHDNFFQLGGNSLAGTQMIVRVREVFGIDVPLRTLFEAPNICELASEILRLQLLQQGTASAARMLAEIEALDDDAVAELLKQSR